MVLTFVLSTLLSSGSPIKGVSATASFKPKLSCTVVSPVAFLEVLLTSEVRLSGHFAVSHADSVRRFLFKIMLNVSPFY